jgi:hypothetical protein
MGELEMDSQDFTSRMQALSDEELGEIVSFGERDGFLPSAVAAARKELITRNLSPTSIREIAVSIKTKRDKDTELASRPLSWPGRIAFSICSISLVPIIVAVALQIKGYKQKFRRLEVDGTRRCILGWAIHSFCCFKDHEMISPKTTLHHPTLKCSYTTLFSIGTCVGNFPVDSLRGFATGHSYSLG